MRLTPTQQRALTWPALSIVAAALLWLLAPALTPFLIGAVLAYPLHPPVEQLAARGVPRLLAASVVEITAMLALTALVLLIVPILTTVLPQLRDAVAAA